MDTLSNQIYTAILMHSIVLLAAHPTTISTKKWILHLKTFHEWQIKESSTSVIISEQHKEYNLQPKNPLMYNIVETRYQQQYRNRILQQYRNHILT